MPNFHAWFPHTYMKKTSIFMSFRAIITDSFPPTSDNYALNFILLKVSHLLLFYSFHGLFMFILCSESFVEYTFFVTTIHSFILQHIQKHSIETSKQSMMLCFSVHLFILCQDLKNDPLYGARKLMETLLMCGYFTDIV